MGGAGAIFIVPSRNSRWGGDEEQIEGGERYHKMRAHHEGRIEKSEASSKIQAKGGGNFEKEGTSIEKKKRRRKPQGGSK